MAAPAFFYISPMSDNTELISVRSEELRLFERRVLLQEKLPHLYGWKFYKWARDFFETRNKIAVLCAANQISKSSSQIRKMIHWATAQDQWPQLWSLKPKQFWLLYPTRDVAHIEYEKKIKAEFLPKDEFKEDNYYGWTAEIYHRRIWAIHFKSGVTIYFKTYGQDVEDLQSGTCDYIGLDEEPPEEIMSELFMRLASTDGYLSAVFTPTTGQPYWSEVFDTGDGERLKGAWKQQVSMYDCLEYEDGTPSPWTQKKITRAINSCRSAQDVDRRVHGKFVLSEGLKFPGFHKTRNLRMGHPLPKGWSYWAGVDPGSGGVNHPAAIVVVGIDPLFIRGRVFRGWRGDEQQTTAGDVVERALQMTKDLESCSIYYDHGCRDFFLIAQDRGLVVMPAEKSHAIGEQWLNVLFKNEMLHIYDYPELQPLVRELQMLKAGANKRAGGDDYVDALRYAISSVPWDWRVVKDDAEIKTPSPPGGRPTRKQAEKDERRRYWEGDGEDGLLSIESEIDSWNELMEVGSDT